MSIPFIWEDVYNVMQNSLKTF